LQEQVVDENIFNWLPLQSRHELEELLLGEHLIQQQVLDLQVRHEHNINIPVSVAINKINFHGQFVYVAVMRNNTSQQLQKKLLVQQNAQLVHKTKELKRQQEINGELTRKNERKKNAFMLSFTNYLAANSSEQSQAIQNRIANVQQYFRLQTRQEQCVQKPLMLKTELEMLIQDQAKAIEQAGVKVKVNLNKSLQVVFDQEHLYKVFEELLVNAIQFSLKGGKIEFVQSLITDTHVEVAVNDTGIGILEHKQLQLFDIYELNSANKKELSTGLPLAKALVQANRGEIYVDNHYDQDEVIGSVFRVKLPTK